MRIFRFDPDTGKKIEQYCSVDAIFNGILRIETQLQIGVITLEPGGLIGEHEASEDQLLLVVRGSAWVRGVDESWQKFLALGRAAFWTKGEFHQTGSETGMTAVVIEGDGIDPGEFMVEETE